ncbi:MAG: thiol:disulfide interchange protein [Rhodobacteraceae bacterium GWE1_64_9]|jgi:thiol-disulfide isomerase/thioredoxin|uniref:TlpA family protein disulfide reductase n=1 Tax=Paracoccaceae TaxID=31989 RepID=UPI0008D70202|nr:MULTISPECIES: TlpA disulfide reductase family protein [Paracoccaceae]MDZ4087102.1 TlpA disulfide reductase family protein [Tabrizicola sp.]OHC46275.1 MAG: thiol:disulfide interchange protein [Rhodobacteraceae bacterium GWE1_64_9]OHC47478.1 MAG: thiol:disulfide interchange protein [Rhodobacteraceae bacterium GWF1_65_7]
MLTHICRRSVLVGLAMPYLATPAEARPPFRLRSDPQQLLSPPILDEKGTTRYLDDFAGRVILLNIWATWCPPCREEMPMLERLEKRLGGADFAVLPLCIDDAGIGRGRQFYDEIGLDALPLYWAEPLRVQLALAFIGLPTTLLIDRQSREIGRLQGPFAWDSDDAVEQIVGAF